MRKKASRLVFVLSATFFLTLTAVAWQDIDNPSGQTRTNGFYANLFHFEFNPGKTDDALEILNNTLIPAYKNTGVDATLIEDLMGTKDIWLIIPLQDGPSYYSFVLPKQDAEAWKELSKIAGSAEKAEIELDKFIGYVKRQSQTLVFIHKKN